MGQTNPLSEKKLSFPRFVGGNIPFLAVFGDASKIEMGVAVYTVSQNAKNVLVSHLAFAKSSFMPKNLREKALLQDSLTIARAELVAIKMAVTAGQYVANSFKMQSKNIFIFTDSLLNL